jgi:hypothetical protein
MADGRRASFPMASIQRLRMQQPDEDSVMHIVANRVNAHAFTQCCEREALLREVDALPSDMFRIKCFQKSSPELVKHYAAPIPHY